MNFHRTTHHDQGDTYVKRHAKAPTAGSTQRQAGRLGRFFRGAFATRASSPGADGSGAPSIGFAPPALFVLACLVFLALVALLGSGAPSAGAADSPCPNQEFRTGPGANLPDCRAYEQVSPVDKNGGDINAGAGEGRVTTVADNGSKATFFAITEFAGTVSGGNLSETHYVATRNADRWGTLAMFPRGTPIAAQRVVKFSTPDLARSLLYSSGVVESTPPAGAEESNLYLRNNETNVVTPFLGISSDSVTNEFEFPVASPSADHVAFASPAVLAPDPGIPGTGVYKTYEKVGGEIRLVSVKPDGTPFEGNVYPGGASFNLLNPYSTVGAVSDDGSHIFFTVEGEIYRRSNGTTTVLASPSKRAVPDPEGAKEKEFRIATPDGGRLLFTSSELLTDDANTGPTRQGADLYRYDFEADELIDISATAGGNGAQVEGVVGADENAERVYYTARGQVVPGQGTPGQANLYLWEDDGTPSGTTRFIAALAPVVAPFSDHGDGSNWYHLDSKWTARTTADGRYLLFRSKASIPGGETGGLAQLYRYDAEANGGAGQLDCVSCNPDGDVPLGPTSIPEHLTGTSQYWELPRVLSADGQSVFFNTPDDLLPSDTNGKIDPYMWSGGQLHLLSTGTSDRDSRFYGASADGSDAFFLTADALVPQDGDDLMDLYDARVNGGFASQFATPPPGCTGEECRGAGSQNPPGPAPLSSSLQGAGNPVSRRNCSKQGRKAKKLSNRAKRLRRHGKQAKRNGKSAIARKRNHKATRLAQRARSKSNRAKRCRRAERRAQR